MKLLHELLVFQKVAKPLCCFLLAISLQQALAFEIREPKERGGGQENAQEECQEREGKVLAEAPVGEAGDYGQDVGREGDDENYVHVRRWEYWLMFWTIIINFFEIINLAVKLEKTKRNNRGKQ